jgi:hypothetical protein
MIAEWWDEADVSDSACSSRHFFTGAVLALSVLHGAILDYLKQIMKSTNMPYLTPEGAVSGDCDLSANMYALVIMDACPYCAGMLMCFAR